LRTTGTAKGCAFGLAIATLWAGVIHAGKVIFIQTQSAGIFSIQFHRSNISRHQAAASQTFLDTVALNANRHKIVGGIIEGKTKRHAMVNMQSVFVLALVNLIAHAAAKALEALSFQDCLPGSAPTRTTGIKTSASPSSMFFSRDFMAMLGLSAGTGAII